ncbi:DUF3310 domain-containing protein [Listeria booriae]|uniref:DUF3310 domain-containing protein n=2 Tax=Listeria booriae TaxID=1552123 RepID=UPI0021AD77B6|nr:DUF3310 domain-containing protein [Listeria booriae]
MNKTNKPLTVEIRTVGNTEDFSKRIRSLYDSFRYAFKPDEELIKLQNRLAEENVEKMVEDNPLKQFMTNPTKYNSMKLKQYKEEPKMKIYHTETQEDYDALMVELEKEGFLWASGKKPTYSLFKWNEFGKDTCIHLDNKFITRSDLAFVNQSYPSFAIEKYKANDNVNNPSHYNTGGIETLDYIKAKVPDYTSVAMSQVIKYISRFPHKNGLEDLKKAQFYLNDLIKFMEDDK